MDLAEAVGIHLTSVSGKNTKLNSKFTGSYIPDIKLELYCIRLYKYFDCSLSNLVLALIYLEKFLVITKITINPLSVHRLYLIALTLSVKYSEDETYNNTFYSKVGGIDLEEFNLLEVYMLSSLKYKLDVSPDLFSIFWQDFYTV
jgi:hypothetical protein